MTDSVNMSLDEIINQNRSSRTRGRGGGSIRGRGNGRGGRRGRGGRGGAGAPHTRSQSRAESNNRQGRSRSRSRGPQGRPKSRGRSQSRGRAQSRNRSRSQQRRYSYPRSRSGSRSRSRLSTPKGRAGLEDAVTDVPPLLRSNRGTRGNRGSRGLQTRLRWPNSNQQSRGGVHSRLGMNAQKQGGGGGGFKPLAVAKWGISKRGRGLNTRNRYSSVGLRSDQILKEQRQNIIRSQTFRRSRNNSLSSASQLTVSVANDFGKRRRNSVGNEGYLNKNTLAKLNNAFGGYNFRKGPGSVKSVGSNRSNRSNRSNSSKRSNQSRGRGRGRGSNRGVGRNFVNKQILNPKLQKEIAVIQGKNYGGNQESPAGINFTPTPAATKQTLHQRFAIP